MARKNNSSTDKVGKQPVFAMRDFPIKHREALALLADRRDIKMSDLVAIMIEEYLDQRQDEEDCAEALKKII